MNYQRTPLAAALYLVAMPIGNARDVTLRALDVLASADVLAAEDTRTLARLMQIHGVPREGRPLVAYHDHARAEIAVRLAQDVQEGRSVAYSSDAGMPLVSDPGYGLVAAMAKQGARVTVVPGPSAALAALALAGLPTDAFTFLGFPPPKAGARARWLTAQARRPETLVVFEAPHRMAEFLEAACTAFGPGRQAALCREMTKLHEQVRRGSLETLRDGQAADPVRGECVVLIAGAEVAPEATEADLQAALVQALARSSVKTAVQEVAELFEMPRKTVYRMALDLQDRT